MIYIQKQSRKYKDHTHFEFEFEKHVFKRLYKLYKGDIEAMIKALYRDKDKKETRIHRWFLEFYIPSITTKKFKYQVINLPLKDILNIDLDVNIELLYEAIQTHTINYNIETLKELHAVPQPIQDFLYAFEKYYSLDRDEECNIAIQLAEKLQLPMTKKIKDEIVQEFFLFDDVSIISMVNNLCHDDRIKLFDIVAEYFSYNERAWGGSLSEVRRLVWHYDIPVKWSSNLLHVDINFLQNRYQHEDIFDGGGIMLEYWIMQNPERLTLFQSMLDGITAKPSEMIAFFKTGQIPHNVGISNDSEMDLLLT